MKELTFEMKSGLDSREAALFVQTAGKFDSHIHVKVDGKTINAKSIMGIISISVLTGQSLTIVAEGEDEVNAAETLAALLMEDK